MHCRAHKLNLAVQNALIGQKRSSNTHLFVVAQKHFEISVAMGFRKVTIVGKLSILVPFGYFPQKHGSLA